MMCHPATVLSFFQEAINLTAQIAWFRIYSSKLNESKNTCLDDLNLFMVLCLLYMTNL